MSLTSSKQHRITTTLVCGVAVLASVVARASELERHAERPAAQAGVPSSTSYMQRSFTLPAAGFLDFRYFVDSQEGHDFLRAYVDGAQVFEQSGLDRIGRTRQELTAGTHTIRFAYQKDGSGDAGRDTAQVDDVTVRTSKGQEVFRFNSPSLAAPEGWSVGGSGGGWSVARPSLRRGLQRPASIAFRGYAASGVVASTQRSITWPAGSGKNLLKVAYAVDSEEGADFFRIYVDGVEKLAVSGANRSGIASIDVGAAGAHIVRFAYAKDQSVDEGLDDARVLRLEAIASGKAFQTLDLDGAELGASASGWVSASGSEPNWTMSPSFASLAHVPVASAPPVVDGLRDPAYAAGARLNLGDFVAGVAPRGKVQALLASSSLYLLGQVRAGTAAVGDESGSITLYLDRERTKTRAGLGCPGAVGVPGPEDRKLVVSYDIPESARTADVMIAQYVGTCLRDTPWSPATVAQALGVSAAVVEPEREEVLGIELSVNHGTTADELGVGLQLATTEGVGFEMPAIDAQPVSDADATTWATIVTTPPAPRLPVGTLVVGDLRPTATN
jgi:hypothetical protein